MAKNIWSIGETKKGAPILTHRIGVGQRKILFVSGIHGNEVGTVKLAYHLIRWFEQQKQFCEKYTILVISCLNLDGFLLARAQRDYAHGGRIGRCNAAGVDLNRNFPTRSFTSHAFWNHGAQYSNKIEIFAGTRGGSEPETEALIHFIQQEKISTIIAFHNAGKDVVASADDSAQKLAALYSTESGYRYMTHDEWLTLGQTGTFKEWCEENLISYLEIETSNRYSADWRRNRRAILRILIHMQ